MRGGSKQHYSTHLCLVANIADSGGGLHTGVTQLALRCGECRRVYVCKQHANTCAAQRLCTGKANACKGEGKRSGRECGCTKVQHPRRSGGRSGGGGPPLAAPVISADLPESPAMCAAQYTADRDAGSVGGAPLGVWLAVKDQWTTNILMNRETRWRMRCAGREERDTTSSPAQSRDAGFASWYHHYCQTAYST